MSNENAVQANPTNAPKAKATKKPAKKAVKKVAKAKGKKQVERRDRGPSKLQLAVLGVLAKSKRPLSRSELSDKLDGAFIGGKVMGHVDSDKTTETSLIGRKLVAWGTPEEGGPNVYQITKAGAKSLAESK